ncbi:hypothetical protein Q5705_08270 [Kosakonia sp. H02]|nr:hypothetical protein Q5705_08270 [Kosakonia sp. H02]
MKAFKKISLALLVSAAIINSSSVIAETVDAAPANMAVKGNHYPLVFVHGLAGWGTDEMLGFKYWGGFDDTIAYLNGNGVESYAAAVGPVSSNWDRAVELYYYIKGGTVDYGAAHSQKANHARYGKTFPGLYPKWDEHHKIHLIGHSMGGLSSRQLVDMLQDGNEEERAYHEAHPETEISPLFEGGKDYVFSVSTVATPNNGTSYAQNKNLIVGLAEDLIRSAASIAGVTSLSSFVYDFKLDQFGLRRDPDESLSDYIDDVFASSIWNSKDIASYDLSVVGVTANKKNIETKPNVYYFSYTGTTTVGVPFTSWQIPSVYTNPALVPSATYMGKTTSDPETPLITAAWTPNDGEVNVVSSSYPFGDNAKPYDGNPVKGQWSYYPVMKDWDHLDFIGLDVIPQAYVNEFYADMATTLLALDK